MTGKIYIPAKYEMVVDPQAMTISVGSRVFNEPDLSRRLEWNFDFKASICGYPEGARDIKKWHKFYAEMLGCRFNFRFFAANYWLWLGDRMERRTANMLKYEGKHWRHYNTSLVQKAHKVLPYINEAERDGLFNLIPIIIIRGNSPQAIRADIGRGAWRRIANNSVARNVLIMNAISRCNPKFATEALERLLDMPSGVIRAVGGYTVTDDEVVAARITPRKRIQEFTQTLHLVRDTREMLMPADFNPKWGLARMRQEHEAATRAVMQRRFSNKRFAEDFVFSGGGFTATLLTSQVEIATEGEVQHHCVASYARRAASGDYAVFKIEGKERATAGIAGNRLDQVYGSCNAPVSDDCRNFSHMLAFQYSQKSERQAA
jgi:hypothetical protein